MRFIPPPAETDGVPLEVEQQDGADAITHSRVSILMSSNEDGWCVRVPAPPTAQQSNSRLASLLEQEEPGRVPEASMDTSLWREHEEVLQDQEDGARRASHTSWDRRAHHPSATLHAAAKRSLTLRTFSATPRLLGDEAAGVRLRSRRRINS